MTKVMASVAVLLLVLSLAWAQQTRPADAAGRGAGMTQVERGKYLVHHVAMCIECHTPRNERGELIMGRLLHGARMPVGSPFPNQTWCFETPRIADLPGWSDAEAVKFFMTGDDKRGYKARAPMPQFRMTREDAEAVVAYLRTVQ